MAAILLERHLFHPYSLMQKHTNGLHNQRGEFGSQEALRDIKLEPIAERTFGAQPRLSLCRVGQIVPNFLGYCISAVTRQ